MDTPEEQPQQITKELSDLNRDFVVSEDGSSVDIFLGESEWQQIQDQRQQLSTVLFNTLRKFPLVPGHESEMQQQGFEIAMDRIDQTTAFLLKLLAVRKLLEASMTGLRQTLAMMDAQQLAEGEGIRLANTAMEKSDRISTLIEQGRFKLFVREDILPPHA